MNPYPYLKAFAWIAIVALTCSIFTSYWIPIVVGALLAALLLRVVLPSR
jgi:hypothetical protein